MIVAARSKGAFIAFHDLKTLLELVFTPGLT